MFIAVGSYIYMNIEDSVCCKIVYSPNGNDPVKIFIPLHNSANTSKKSVWPGSLIDLIEPFVESHTRPIFVNCYQGFTAEDVFFFIGGDVGAEPCNNTGHDIFGHAGLFPGALYQVGKLLVPIFHLFCKEDKLMAKIFCHFGSLDIIQNT